MKKLTLIAAILLTVGLFSSLNLKSQNSRLANMDEYILNQMELSHKPGLAAVIIKGDSVVWSGNYGFAILEDSIEVTNNTLFNAFSIGKSITASCVLQMWEDQLIGLDENINNFLPFQIDNPNIQSDSITPRMLMSHVSSIVDYNMLSYITVGDPTESLASFLENYLSSEGAYYNDNNFSNHPPGTFYTYTNFGSALNGFLVEPLTGMSFNEYANEYMLNPLEMEVSAWFLDELNIDNLATGYSYIGGNYQPYLHYGIPAYPGMSLRSNVFDLANYVIMLLNKGSYKGLQLLDGATIDSMMVIQPSSLCGLGLQNTEIWNNAGTFQRDLWGHKGGGDFGYAGEIQFCPDDFTGIVYLSNSENYSTNIKKILFDYAAMVVIAEPAIEITDTGFTAIYQSAPDALGYFLDVSEDENFSSFIEDYENFDIGLDTMYAVNDLSSNTDYYYRIRAYNDYDTGAYSNTISLNTLLGTGFVSKLITNIKVWSSNNVVYIELPQNTGFETSATFYSLTGQLLHKSILTDGINFIRMDIRKQPIIIKVNAGNKSSCKKVMVW